MSLRIASGVVLPSARRRAKVRPIVRSAWLGPAVVPHTAKAAIYDLFGLEKANRQIIATIQQHLSQEGYDVKLVRRGRARGAFATHRRPILAA